jgi:hypothetical protein
MKMKSGIARKLAALCGPQPKTQNPWIDVDKKIIIATDGHGLVVLPFTPEDGETSGFVPHQALRIWDCASRKRKSTIHCAGRVVVTFLDDEQTSFPRTDSEFVDWTRLPRSAAECGTATISLDADLLANIQHALGSAGVTLWIENTDKGIMVSGLREEDGMALMMPMRPSMTTYPRDIYLPSELKAVATPTE